MSQRTTRTGLPGYVILGLLALFALGPLVLFAFNSLKTRDELAVNSFGPPSGLHWANFAEAWQEANMAAGLRNSVIVVLGTVVGVCVIAGLAAYALARMDLPHTGGIMLWLVVGGALPTQMFLVPLFFLWAKLNLYDSLFGLIVVYWALFAPFATLLLRSFLVGLPREYEEAARIDGASELRILTRVVAPVAAPGFLTVALVTGLSAYNEFLFAVTFIQDSDKMPVSTALFSFQQGFTQDYALLSAAGLIMLLPMVLLFLFLQRRFIDGIAASGLGGT
ncbi:carbohydrate ABC transporter permease [Saccharopolyspora sp. K220]|uniref:carbohydrate ABC transporter permease n=1 Tax=Saccharopolyspora soli TaxID=2926618 RepID=UPI001F5990E9|nr:carbohydrate ABC transporter permease [Saccharopolyspora soli]MCI2416145.1 carbohydrate ABC transporter permease [Saccharopolyspora soli]